MPRVRFDKFYKHAELTSILKAWAEEKPNLFRLSSLGQSYAGRDIWLATLTNFAAGRDTEKPALWIDANIHATEVTGCTAALYLINKLLVEHGANEKVTRALDTRTFYIVPRLNPDGAELALADRPKFIRSSVRPYPRADEPRLLVPRDPDDAPGSEAFYRLLPEGTIRNFDGVLIKKAPPLEGLDLNRNFPMDWEPESGQPGAGPYPTSEPEIRAIVQAIVDRPNITGYINYHTFSGVHLRPYSARPDDDFPTPDLRVYKLIGEWATKITGYPARSVFHDFKYDPKRTIRGASDDWMYEHLGVYAWTTEFWSPQRQVGLQDYHMIEWMRDHPVEDDLKLLKWSDETLGRRGYVDWYPFEHPQLGRVELGGWDSMYCWANVPPDLLEKEIAPHADFAIFHVLISPQMAIHSLDVKPLGAGTHHVRLVLANTGWLPTHVTQKALDRQAVRPIEVELTLPDGATVVSGEKKVEAGQLEGRAHKRSVLWFGNDDSTTDRAKLEWVIAAPQGGTLTIEARHPRAGTVRREVEIADSR